MFATKQSLPSLSLTVAKWSVENVQFCELAFRVIYPEVSPLQVFSGGCIFVMATILQLKVAKRWLFEKVSLERCVIVLLLWVSNGPIRFKVLTKFGLCSNCLQKLHSCSLVRARKILQLLACSLRWNGTLKYGVHEKFNLLKIWDLPQLNTYQKHFETILLI